VTHVGRVPTEGDRDYFRRLSSQPARPAR